MRHTIELGIRKRTKFYELECYRSRDSAKKLLFTTIFHYVNLYLKSMGLEIQKIQIIEYMGPVITYASKDEIDIEYKSEFINKIEIKKLELHNDQMEDVAEILQHAKDKANLSEKTYNNLRDQINKTSNFKLKSLHKLNNVKSRINRFFEIKNNLFGCYVNAEQKINYVLTKIYHRENKEIENDTFRIHLSGDGMSISKTKINMLNFTFKVLNDKNDSALYTLGIFRVSTENYESIKTALNEIIERLNSIRSVTMENKRFNIDWTNGGDLKWIANINGINGANANHPCPWCTWDTKDATVGNDNYNIFNRSHKICQEKLKEKDEKKRLGYKSQPLLKFIEFHKNIVDPLHLCLRITDKLFDKLLVHLDLLEKNNTFELEKRPLLNELVEFLEVTGKITSPIYFCEQEKKVSIRSLNQNERLKILKLLKTKKNLLALFPKYKDDKKILLLNYVLLEFYSLFTFIKQDHTASFDKKSLVDKLHLWLYHYKKANNGEKLTPYIHIFIVHIPEFIEVYKNINRFSTQALEKLNSTTKTNFFRQTNRKIKARTNFIKQLINKANRLDYYYLNRI